MLREHFKELLQAVGEQFPNGSINVFDQELRYLYADGHGLSGAGLNSTMLVGRRLDEVFPPEQVALTLPFYRRALDGEFVQFELPLSGTIFGISAGPLRSASDQVIGVVAVAQDIAAFKQTEHRLRVTERELRAALARLERENVEKGEFLSTMAHEMRQPLQACMGALAVMRGAASKSSGLRARDILQRQIEHMTQLVSDLLEASAAVKQQVPLALAPIALADTLRHAVDSIMLSDTAPSRFLLTMPETPLHVTGDATKLERAFLNLLTNAARHTPTDGRIELVASEEDDFVVVKIRDNGVGIDPMDLEQIFDLFHRGSAPKGKGLGIGLTLVRAIVAQHGGTVEAKSDGVGRGAEFVVRLPRDTTGAPS